jgi:hypothetical protein
VVGVGGIAGRPRSERSVAELAAVEPGYDDALAAVRRTAGELPDELVQNLAWGLAGRPSVLVVELPSLPAEQEVAAWSLLARIAADGPAVVVATPTDERHISPHVITPETAEVSS